MLPTPPASPKPSGECIPEDNIGLILAGSIELTGVLGVGAYGTVYRARDLINGSDYAVKALNKVGLDQRQKKFQDREIQLHYLASQHPNVVSLVKILDSAECTYVVMEYCPEGDLFSKITEEGHYIGDDFKAKQVFLQILSAVQHCHSMGVYHRDLKPENVLVQDQGWTVKLADFGLATQDRVTSDFGCGSTFYMSPECQNPSPKPFSCYASAPNDIWSLGVILVNLTCGRNPWKRASVEDSTFRAYMRDRNFLQSILPITKEFNHILQRIFDVNPRNRVTLEELRESIVACPRLTTNGSGAGSVPSTPPYSPVEEPVNSSCTAYSGYDAVPRLDLPAQQYPPSPEYFYPSPESSAPSSGQCSPQPTIYTAPPKSLAPIISTGHFFSNFQRYGQMITNFNIPTPNHMWTTTY